MNDRCFIIQNTSDPIGEADLTLRLTGNESKEQMTGIIQSFESNAHTECLCLRSAELEKSWNTFSQIYEMIDAAGGVVINAENNFLLIYRNGKWDLPKGKIESGEEPDTAALREVEEECGIGSLTIIRPLETMYHTYPYDGKKVLKRTFWYLMETHDNNTPVPQQEEGITDVRWLNYPEAQHAVMHSYASVKSLLNNLRVTSDLRK